MKEVITVPFSKKKEAVALGAEFDITDRQWYITDNTEFENHEALRHLADVEVQEIAIELPEEDQPLAEKEVSIEGETEENDETFFDWSAILDSRDSLKIAMTLRNHKVPAEESFEKAYPPEKIQALAMKLTSPGNYLMRIRNSELSAEEKALMYFVLPFGAE